MILLGRDTGQSLNNIPTIKRSGVQLTFTQNIPGTNFNKNVIGHNEETNSLSKCQLQF